MKHASFTIISLIVLIELISCTTDKPTFISSNNISIINPEEIPFQDQIQDVKLLQLELTEGSAMQYASKAKEINDSYYILDPGLNAVFNFDREGKFIRKIANPGEGPGTIDLVVDFGYNDSSNNIELLSPTGKIVGFNIFTGAYQDVLNMRSALVPVYGFEYLSADQIVFFSNLKEYLYYTVSREKEEIVSTGIKNDFLESIDWHSIHPFEKMMGRTVALDMYSSTVYEIGPDKVTPYRKIDFGNKGLNLQEPGLHNKIVASGDVSNLLSERGYLYPISYFYENDEMIILRVLEASAYQKIMVYRKKSKQWTVSDVTELGDIYMRIMHSGDDFVGSVNDLSMVITLFPEQLLADDTVVLPADVDEKGNPVLFFYRFR